MTVSVSLSVSGSGSKKPRGLSAGAIRSSTPIALDSHPTDDHPHAHANTHPHELREGLVAREPFSFTCPWLVARGSWSRGPCGRLTFHVSPSTFSPLTFNPNERLGNVRVRVVVRVVVTLAATRKGPGWSSEWGRLRYRLRLRLRYRLRYRYRCRYRCRVKP
jgi:hypothetical protein